MSSISEPGDRSRWDSQKFVAARGSTGLGEGANADRQASSGTLHPRSTEAAATVAADESARSFDDPSVHVHQPGPWSFSVLGGSRPNVEADFLKFASWSQTGLAGA